MSRPVRRTSDPFIVANPANSVNFVDPSGLLKAAPYNGGHLGDVTVVGHYDPSISHNGGSVWDYAYSDHWGTDPFDTADPYVPETDPGDPFGLGDPQQPKPLTYIEGCLSLNNILANSKIKELFDEAWKRTKASGEENGGVIFYDAKANTIFIEGASQGRHEDVGKPHGVIAAMPDFHKEFIDELAGFRQQGRSVVLLATFHTHPGKSEFPSQFDGITLGQMNPDAVGIIITGEGSYSMYNFLGKIPPNHSNAKDCH